MDSLESKAPQDVEPIQPEVTTTETATEATSEAAVATEQKTAAPTREDIVERFKALLQGQAEDIQKEAEQLKTQFYRIYKQEQEEAKRALENAKEQLSDIKDELKESIAEEVNEQTAENKAAIDEVEQQFKALLAAYKQKKAEATARREAEMAQNQLRKENIIAQIKRMAESETADVSEQLPQVKALQQEWKTIGPVPPQAATSLWKEYNLYQEKFYDLVKINNELREYDFKKNLELKTALCEKAEALTEKPEVVEAFRMLQQLHDEWANIGPVARDLREDLWNRFKKASTIINKKHQAYFEQLHEKEEENLQQKQGIIEQLKTIDLTTLTTAKLWDTATETVKQLQEQWKQIGFAPKKVNQEIYNEYLALCNQFYTAKNNFYKQLKEMLADNLQKKRELLQKAEQWKDSEEWDKATDALVKLQKEWKEIGPVARKYSDDLWKQFTAACDGFFERKKATTQNKFAEERKNLEKKREILKEIEQLAVTTKNETVEKLKELIARYNAVGFVPFKEKDKLYKQFRTATDRIFNQLNIDSRNRRLEEFSKEVEEKDDNALLNERRHLVRKYESLQQEIKTSENNILFFTGSSNKSSQLIEDMERNIARQKQQLKELEERINLIDSKLD